MTQPNWHDTHKKQRTFGDKAADGIAANMGSWRFIIIQSIVVVLWMVANTVGIINHWDVYPFILLNLLFSTQAAYAAPIIMMSQNRSANRDRVQAQHDYNTNIEAEQRIEQLQDVLAKLELNKLDKIIRLLEEKK